MSAPTSEKCYAWQSYEIAVQSISEEELVRGPKEIKITIPYVIYNGRKYKNYSIKLKGLEKNTDIANIRDALLAEREKPKAVIPTTRLFTNSNPEPLKIKRNSLFNSLPNLSSFRRHSSAISLSRPLCIPAQKENLSSTLSDAMEVAWTNFDERASFVIKQMPNIKLNKNNSPLPTCLPYAFDLNNNGWDVSNDDISFCIDKENNTLKTKRGLYLVKALNNLDINSEHKNQAYYDPKIRLLYATPLDAIYHDTVIVSNNPDRPVVITLCDGCGKGRDVSSAAYIAAKAAQDIFNDYVMSCKNTQDIARALFKTMKEAQSAIALLETCRDTTYLQLTIIQGMVLGLVLGDSKAFIFRPGDDEESSWSCIDLTPSSRDVADMKNPGGFLKSSSELPPDTIGMRAFYASLQENDVLFVCSDGIPDNFDPRTHGILPSILEIETSNDSWEEVDKNDRGVGKKIEAFISKNMAEQAKGAKNGEEVRNRLVEHILTLQNAKKISYLTAIEQREWETMPGKPDDAAHAYFEYKPNA